MSNASLKEQLQAMASQIAGSPVPESPKAPATPAHKAAATKPKKKFHSAPKAKKPKPKWLEYAQYGVELLRAYFPECFKSPAEVKPLKKGIKQDLVKRLSILENVVTEDKACMVKSLAYYVNTAAYHKSVIEGATRVDLDGTPAGVVSAEEAKYSIERHQAKLQAKQTALASSQPHDKESTSHRVTT